MAIRRTVFVHSRSSPVLAVTRFTPANGVLDRGFLSCSTLLGKSQYCYVGCSEISKLAHAAEDQECDFAL
ncbi:hypothetical protein Y032_0637g953 [Ancylostoma ceylanicum]|uniref:Uncharacterized protein n=1 Tax=Ancylostoma ceylanicum TaxID=53326 RepID=A0A016WJ81_9BILA|nr:hypothetical protein Y032_0637g953 [Ancylostoma ceylanicum]